MKNDIPKYVTKARAAYLLGMPAEQIARISQETGIGHHECAGDVEETFFTYAELQKICVLATASLDTVLH